MPRLTINETPIEVPAGTTVLEAARIAGIEIPTLCHHRDLSPTGSCRMCLVEIDGRHGQHAACTLPVDEAMAVRTESTALSESRRFVLDLLLDKYVETASDRLDRGETEFEQCVRKHHPQALSKLRQGTPRFEPDSDPNPFIRVDLNKCILCTRCVRACNEIQGRFVWSVAQRGHESYLIAGQDTSMLEGRCESCGACAAYCPTGALEDRMAQGDGPAEGQVRTTCGYCGVGCQFDVAVRAGRVSHVAGTPEAPVNGTSLCVKGRYGYDFVHHPQRLTRPQVRQYLLDGQPASARDADRGPWVAVDWTVALDVVARRLAAIRSESGPDCVGVLSSAKCTNEENFLAQKFARQVIGTHNVDHCARLCHASTVAGLAMAFGSGAMSNSMDDVAQQAAALFVIGSNTTEQHPVFGAQLRQAVLRRGAKLVVADPRRIDLAEFASLHLRQRPGTDVALLNGLMHVILQRGWHDRVFIQRRCEDFDVFQEALARYTPQVVCEITGITRNQLLAAAELIATNRPLAVIWAMGITQHTTGVLNVLSLANLQMLLGNMGVPGGGVNPLRGQNNVQGACDMGALPNVYPGYQSVADTAIAGRFQTAWSLKSQTGRATTDSTKPGLTVTEMIESAGRNQMRALYILGEDPAMTEPDSNRTRAALAAAEFVVLQEIFPSETSAYADVLLPAASAFEKNGTFTNTDRRVQSVRLAVDPPGEAWPDWRITSELAKRMLAIEGCQPAGAHAAWDYSSPAEVLAEINALTPSYAGITQSRLERGERLQWPVPAADHPGTPILHAEQFTRGRGKFHVAEHLAAAELPDEQYPLLLTTGRILYHWHGGELTRRASGLLKIAPEPTVEINPEDAARMHLTEGENIRVVSRRGELVARAIVTDRVSAGIVFGNFHFPSAGNVNNLTIAALDPIAKIPEYKVCAVRLTNTI